MLHSTLTAFLRLYISLTSLLTLVLATSSSSPSPLSSPSSADQLSQICPSSDPSSCYPSVFQPTLDFQPILEGQSIPRGLHVRLNMATGEKEARLNVPMESEVGREIETVFAGEGTALLEVPQPEEVVLITEGREELR